MPLKGSFTTTSSAKILRKRSGEIEGPQYASSHCCLLLPLALLAASPDGSTEALLLAHGFSTEMIAGLIRDGHADTQAERAMAGGRAIEIIRVRITDEGRHALVERAK